MYAHLRRKLAQVSLKPNSAASPLIDTTGAVEVDSAISPILTLPPEIIIEIFIQCLRISTQFPSSEHAPLLLLQICASWRVLALSTPALWKRLDIELAYSLPGNMDNLERRIAEWTSLASSAPLSLGLYETVRPMAKQMCALLRQYAPRCECLRLRASLKTVSELPHLGPLPLLKKLNLAYSPNGHETVSARAFADAPALRELVLGQHSVPSMLVLPWHQLTTFTGDTLSVAECLFVLRSSPHLTTCTFLYLTPGTAAGEGLTHSCLTDLSISNSTADVLRYIDLPALRDLYLTRPTGFGVDALRQLFAHCAPSLRLLHYAPTYRYRGAISIAWFAAMPQLAELDLGGVGGHFMYDFMRALDRGSAPAFLPHLRTLRIQCDSYEVDAELVAALASRCADGEADSGAADVMLNLGETEMEAGSVKLHSFRLVWAEKGWIDTPHVDALLKLVQLGMRIHVGSAKDNYIGT
ncbi:hypothetical protein B0H19DRAFT_238326 [Mycena capillaripes]|nr:hypothetical protein B0H19DRAFT_238326 [Mycena capillaripes]